MAVSPLPGSAMSNETALNSEQDLASIATAQGGRSPGYRAPHERWDTSRASS
jgi:hypothetical protein